MSIIYISSDSESSEHNDLPPPSQPMPIPPPHTMPARRIRGWRTKEEARKRRHDAPAPPPPPAPPAPPLPFPSSDSDTSDSDTSELLFYEDVNEGPSERPPLSKLLTEEMERVVAGMRQIPVPQKPKRLEKPSSQVLGLVCKRLWTPDTKRKDVENVLKNMRDGEGTSDPKGKGKRKMD